MEIIEACSLHWNKASLACRQWFLLLLDGTHDGLCVPAKLFKKSRIDIMMQPILAAFVVAVAACLCKFWDCGITSYWSVGGGWQTTTNTRFQTQYVGYLNCLTHTLKDTHYLCVKKSIGLLQISNPIKAMEHSLKDLEKSFKKPRWCAAAAAAAAAADSAKSWKLEENPSSKVVCCSSR